MTWKLSRREPKNVTENAVYLYLTGVVITDRFSYLLTPTLVAGLFSRDSTI